MKRTPNQKQLEAIKSKNNTIVIAGAGAGKTFVFTEKYKQLLKYTDEHEILALTYTEKASIELKKRVGLNYSEYLGTFHSVFLKLYNNYAFDLTLLEDKPLNKEDNRLGKILEEYFYKEYLEDTFCNGIFSDKEFKGKVKNIHNLDKFISDNLELCLESNTYNDYVEKLDNAFIEKFKYTDKKIIKKFLLKKRIDKILNFNDIIIEMYFFIKENKNIQAKIRSDFKYIMVDEFQDTNKIVLAIIEMISNNNVFYVGDTLQSIYSFQGADYNIINNLVENSDNLIQLDINYRSSKNIVNLANDFIDSSLKKSDKIKSVRDSGRVENHNIKVIENITDYTIPEIISKSKNSLNEICILTRTNNQIKEIKSILDKYNIPYNKRDIFEVENLLNTMLLMITKDYEPEDEYFNRFDIKLWKEIIKNNSGDNIENYIETIKEIWQSDNIDNYFVNRETNNIIDSKNIFIDRVIKMSKFDFDMFLNSVASRVELYLKNKNYISKSGVNILTIHKSKGLEFEEVILYDQEDGVFPTDINNQEEARLFYVAITRPKSKLYITSKKKINTFTKRLLDNDYIEHIVYKRGLEVELEVKNTIKDIIDFDGDNLIEFKKVDLKKYESFNDKKVFINYIKATNRLLQNNKIENINNYTIEDVEVMLLELEELIKDNEIDYIPLKDMVNDLDLTRELFFTNDKIHFNYINNDFTEYCHEIINYRNLMTREELAEEPKENEQFIKKFKKLVKTFISKKNTDITKDRSKKSLEIQERKLENKVNNEELQTHKDIVKYIIREFFKNSEKQKKYFIQNILNMDDNLNGSKMFNFENNQNLNKLENILIDYVGEKFIEETLKGKFLNEKKKINAFTRWSKLKYLEYKARGQRGAFLTFTSQGHNHIWKMSKEALENKGMRNYNDSSILEKNPNFVMRGDNLIEHIQLIAKEMNQITINFYEVLKSKIRQYEKKNGYKKGHFVLRQLRQVEPHKGLLPHIHEILFLDEEIYHFIQESLDFVIEKYELNPNHQKLIDFDKKEDTERGRQLLKQGDLKDEISLFETENETIKEILKLKKLLKENDLRVLVIKRDVEDIKAELKELKKDSVWTEYKQTKKELDKVNQWLNKDFEPIKKQQAEIMERLLLAPEEQKAEIEAELKEFDLKHLRETASVSSYVAKYLMKGAFASEEDDAEDILNEVIFFNAYINMLGSSIKTTTMTNYDHTTQKHLDKMYLWFQEHTPEKLEYLKGLNKPLYVSLEKFELQGDFIFKYKRIVKENFKNSEYLKDIEEEYNILKVSFPQTDKKELWQIAMNTILNKQNDYLNIHTDKKLIGVYVKENFIRENTVSEEELYIIVADRIENNPHLDWFSVEEEVEEIIERRYSNMVEIHNINYKTIYTEDMYSKSEIKIEELRKLYKGDIETAKEKYKSYYNHKDNYKYEEQQYYSPSLLLVA